MRPPKPWLRSQDQNWYATIDGVRIKLGADEETARNEFDRLMRQRAYGGPLGTHSVRSLLKAYWQWLKENRAPSTVEKRKEILQSFANAIPSTLKIRDLKGHHLQKWVSSLKYRKGKSKNRKLAPTTINNRITGVQAFVNWCVKQGYIDVNRTKIDKPRCAVRQEFVPADTWSRVLDASTDETFREFLIVMLASGARPQEMFRLEARHFDTNRFVLPIHESKGGRRSRIIYVPEEALPIVNRLVEAYPEGRLFRNRDGIPWNSNSIKCRFTRLKRVLKMPKLCATALRHSFAHYRLTQGQDALTVAKLMGHVDTRMIATRYGHLEANVDFMSSAANQIKLPLSFESQGIQSDQPA